MYAFQHFESTLREVERQRNQHMEHERRLLALKAGEGTDGETLVSLWHVIRDRLASHWTLATPKRRDDEVPTVRAA